MEKPLQLAEAVRQACIEAALRAYEDAGYSGLCHKGRWEYAVDAMRTMPLRSVVHALLHGGVARAPYGKPDVNAACPTPRTLCAAVSPGDAEAGHVPQDGVG